LNLCKMNVQTVMTIAEENKKLTADLDAANALVGEENAKVAELSAKVEELANVITGAEAKIVALYEEHAQELEAEKTKVDEIASAKALEIVAQQGAEPADESEAKPAAKTLDELWAHYATLKDTPKEQTRFYRAEIRPRVK